MMSVWAVVPSSPAAVEVDMAAIVVARGVVGSTPRATPCITQASKSSRREMGRWVLGFTPVISLAWQMENGAVKGDSASRMIHAAQNLESTVGGLKGLSWFRARDIDGYFSKTAATVGVPGRERKGRFAQEIERRHGTSSTVSNKIVSPQG